MQPIAPLIIPPLRLLMSHKLLPISCKMQLFSREMRLKLLLKRRQRLILVLLRLLKRIKKRILYRIVHLPVDAIALLIIFLFQIRKNLTVYLCPFMDIKKLFARSGEDIKKQKNLCFDHHKICNLEIRNCDDKLRSNDKIKSKTKEVINYEQAHRKASTTSNGFVRIPS